MASHSTYRAGAAYLGGTGMLASSRRCSTSGGVSVEIRWVAHRGKGSHGLLHCGSEKTTVRNLKDEVDKRAYHKMLKQLCLSQKDLE